MTEAVDAVAIMTVQNAYAVAIDRRDWAALRDCFTPDATISFGMPLRVGTLAEFLDWAPDFHGRLGRTLHQVSTHQAVFQEQVAVASCYLHAILVDATRQAATSVFGRYDDELVRAGNSWKIRQRRFRPTWLSTTAPAEGARS
ncbi:nuclear transport factor 2 family protein [Frankia sp. CNm7]|uniref:Nuclear transport factor 2 family protein n=1 Tax=Frankia nepalensis TaxID=1836974 RepID=A0A937REQ5_9ACTN|nr:nuclear transport factor 2 family protein [Frankia nepalensis]MBL7498970.1 nuclear transport factor 2 family protein [Frankia nepalensis]MBL7511510.1 nuclear transport factor 2 family protein [Frankia nepalensis]MBL7520726.1 nuclear transport factor 2 family protein [Frankia nepalensis]MBL7630753.1 nuclear transport factor 2 family protein [Frankia nepalensis]